MTEKDYIIASNLTRIRVAFSLLQEALAFYEILELDLKEAGVVLNTLDSWLDGLRKKILEARI